MTSQLNFIKDKGGVAYNRYTYCKITIIVIAMS